MPFQSESQRRFMYSQHPELAKEFEKATPKGADLPDHVKKMADGGEVDKTWLEKMADKMSGTAIGSDKSDAEQAMHVDDPQVSSDTVKMADGGKIQDEPGIQDATTSDFLLPYLLGPAAKVGAEGVLPALEGLGETGAVRLGAGEGENIASKAIAQAAPKMEEAVEGGAPKIEAYIKGIQKSPKGDVKIWGVKGPPELLKEHFGDEAPGSVPENILRDKGILPEQVSIPQNAPNAYAEGGKVERSSLAHPVPNAMMARAMKDGGYPHVTFLENETPAKVQETVHLEPKKSLPVTSTETGEKKNPAHMAEGGTVHKAEGRDKEPAKPADINMSHEKKLASIYKAMGIKKYADGGTPDTGAVDESQLPSGMATPNPSDPTYWDQIKAALTKVSAPITGAANAALAPLQPAVDAAMPMVPPAMSAINKLTGANLPVPAPTAAPAPAGAPPVAAAPAMAPQGLPTPAAAPAPAPTGNTAAGMPNIGGIFNQDTSKLTAGVNPEDRQAIVDKMHDSQHGIGAVIAQAVAGLGDAIAAKGGKEQHSLQGIFSMQKDQRSEALANFDKARADRLQKLQLQTVMGDNALKQAAAADAYGVDEHLNGMIGAPKGTMKKDLPTYFSLMSAQVAKQEKDADLYMKAHAQAGTDIDNAVKNASVLSIKPSQAQLQASGAKLADQYYNRAKGNILVKPSDGGAAQWIPAANIQKARQIDPNLQVQP